MKSLTCVVQARISGGPRLPGKMIRPFAGTNLVQILLEKLVSCDNLPQGKIYLSACEKEIIEIGDALGVNIYHRDPESINEDNRSDPLKHMRNVYSWVYDLDDEFFMMINPCNPLLSIDSIERAIERFNDTDVHSLFSVVKRKNYFFDNDSNILSLYEGSQCEREYFYHFGTQWVKPIYEAAHSIYIFSTEFFKAHNMHRFSFSKNDPFLFEIPPMEAFDIDELWQFELAEAMYIKNHSCK